MWVTGGGGGTRGSGWDKHKRTWNDTQVTEHKLSLFDFRASSTRLSWQRIYPEFFLSIVTLSVLCKLFRSYKNSYVKVIRKWGLRAGSCVYSSWQTASLSN